MPRFRVEKDWERSAHAGAEGMYQIAALTMNDEDVTEKIDQGLHFSGEDSRDLVSYLANTFNLKEKNVKIEPEGIEDWPFK